MRRLLAITAMLALATPALAFSAQNRLRVAQDGQGGFTVAFKSFAGTTDYWCAAGDYVVRELGLPDRTRVYRASPDPRKQGQGISFTLDPARSTGDTGITTFGGPQDGGMTAGMAKARYCHDVEIRPFGFGRRG